MTKPARFSVAEVRRLLRAAKAEGYPNPAVDFTPNGGLRLLTSNDSPPADGAQDLERRMRDAFGE